MKYIEDVIETEKTAAYIIVEIQEYIPNSVLSKTIVRKTAGNVSAVSFASDEALTERTSPFDTFVQVIDGKVEIFIGDKSNVLETGQSILIPAEVCSIIRATVPFKIISTVINNGNGGKAT